MVHDDGPGGPNAVEIKFDDERAVSDAGVVLVATLVSGWGSRRSRSASSGSVTASGRPIRGAR